MFLLQHAFAPSIAYPTVLPLHIGLHVAVTSVEHASSRSALLCYTDSCCLHEEGAQECLGGWSKGQGQLARLPRSQPAGRAAMAWPGPVGVPRTALPRREPANPGQKRSDLP